MRKNQTGFPIRQNQAGIPNVKIKLRSRKTSKSDRKTNNEKKEGFPMVELKHDPIREIQNWIPNVKDLSIRFKKRITIR